MLGFPSYSFLTLLVAFAVFGLFGTAFVIWGWRDREKQDAQDRLKLILATFIAPMFLLVGTILSCLVFTNIYRFRNIDISQVQGFLVIKSSDEYNNDNSQRITINNPEIVQQALLTLKDCSSTFRNHESYQDGYKIKLLFADENLDGNYFLSVYQKSNGQDRKSVVIPHTGEHKNLNIGEFSCPAFQDWVRKNIDHLFPNRRVIPN